LRGTAHRPARPTPSALLWDQIRDDYINLVDPDYWAVKGFCDDIHERKFSFPVIYLIQNRLGRYKELLDIYASTHDLTRSELQRVGLGAGCQAPVHQAPSFAHLCHRNRPWK
jgi:hypothetical protein